MEEKSNNINLKIFLSYSSETRNIAQELYHALINEGHRVFFDRSTLIPGRQYNRDIRNAIQNCDLMVFLISPNAIKEGAYSLTELKLASKKWPVPDDRILPVMVIDTNISEIPQYLSSLTILEITGNRAAEVCAAVEGIGSRYKYTELEDRSTSLNIFKLLKEDLSIILFPISLLFIISVVSIAYSFSSPNSSDIVVFRSIGFILLVSIPFYAAFYTAAKFLHRGWEFVQIGFISGGISGMIGAIFYSFCLWVPNNSDCEFYGETVLIFEKFGRFVFFAYPMTIGLSLVICSILNLTAKSNVSLLEHEKNQHIVPISLFTIFLTSIQIAIAALISKNIKQIGLAHEGPDMGDMDPLRHAGLSFSLGVLGIILSVLFEDKLKDPKSAIPTILYLIQPCIVITYTAIVCWFYKPPIVFFVEGNGIGFVVTIAVMAISTLIGVAFLLRNHFEKETNSG